MYLGLFTKNKTCYYYRKVEVYMWTECTLEEYSKYSEDPNYITSTD
jgi:hypothetical protein